MPDNEKPNRRLTQYILHSGDRTARPPEMVESGDRSVCTWKISGYDEGSPIIWLSSKIADYYCVKPSSGYEKHYDFLFEKACACIEVYKTLSKCNSYRSLEELFAGLARSLSGSKFFSGMQCIYQSICPIARDQCIKHGYHEKSKPAASSATLMIASDIRVGGNELETTCSSIVEAEEDEDAKLPSKKKNTLSL
ncbi:hypothetical protein M0R45_016446 [Rubus argutus]|uniref:RFTS domain-containing protein n=1 Tax=Rubus argutus TaxID=59490 RepID=A0AAW1XT35_RUBAR